MWKVCQNETASSVYYTRSSDLLYVHVTSWPTGGVLELVCPVPTAQTQARMLGLPSAESAAQPGQPQHQHRHSVAVVGRRLGDSGQMSGLTVQLPLLTPDLVPCQHAWVVVLSGIANLL